MEILAQKLKADKKLLVAQTVGVTDEEGKAFWPIYDAYQADLQKINGARQGDHRGLREGLQRGAR